MLTLCRCIVVKMGLFENVLKPSAEVYCKNKSEWEPFVEGTTRLERGS